MFGKKKPEDQSHTSESSSSGIIGQASKTLAFVLKTLAEVELPIESKTKDLLLWKDHILTGKAVKGVEKPDGARDWRAFEKFLERFRSDEASLVKGGFRNLRDLIWQFVDSVGSDVKQRRSNDKALENQLNKLKDVVQDGSIEELRQEALKTVEVISDFSRKYRENQDLRLQELGKKLRAMREELSETKKELSLDKLTRLYNRAAFDEHLSQVVRLNSFSGRPTSILMVDIDYFKKINDNYGHPCGDEVLRQVASSLVDVFPRKTDFVARYGGEEFVVILEEDSLKTADSLAQKLVNFVSEQTYQYEDHVIPVTLSVGVACKLDSESPEAWLKRADQALYRAKNEGRNRSVADGKEEEEQ